MTAKRYTLYVITGPRSRRYIGMTSQALEVRWAGHVAWARQARDVDIPEGGIAHAIKLHGAEAFTIEPLASAVGKDAALLCERQLMEQLHTRFPEGMNHRWARKPPSDVARDWLLLNQRVRVSA